MSTDRRLRFAPGEKARRIAKAEEPSCEGCGPNPGRRQEEEQRNECQ